MIDCKACGFSVNPAMRHSLVRNCCPSCGGALFGDSHKRKLDLFKQRLSGQEFAQSLSDSMIFDIALFMLVEFFPPELARNGEEETPEEAQTEPNPPEEDSYEKIRDAVRSEVMSDIDSEDAGSGPSVRRVTGD